MISIKHLFVSTTPNSNLPYIGKLTKLANKTQLKRKPVELQKKLPIPKHSTPINQN